MQRFRFVVPLLVVFTCKANAQPLELEAIMALEMPYCIDMRIKPERQKSDQLVTTKKLAERFNCHRFYVLPLSVSPTPEMLDRYAEKLQRFDDKQILAWCTHGVRTGKIGMALKRQGMRYNFVKGGTNYLDEVLKLTSD